MFLANFRSSFKFVRQVEWPGMRKKRVCRIKKMRTEREKIICTVIRSLGFQSIKEDAHTPRRAYRGKKQMNKFAFQNNPIPSTTILPPLLLLLSFDTSSPTPHRYPHKQLQTHTRAFFRTPTPVFVALSGAPPANRSPPRRQPLLFFIPSYQLIRF